MLASSFNKPCKAANICSALIGADCSSDDLNISVLLVTLISKTTKLELSKPGFFFEKTEKIPITKYKYRVFSIVYLV